MQKWERALLQMAGASVTFFAWLMAAEVGFLPDNSRGDGVLFRWQVWLLASLVLIATRDLVSQVRSRRESRAPAAAFTAMPDVLKPLWTRRPNKTWLPASWVSTSRMYLRRWVGLSEEEQA